MQVKIIGAGLAGCEAALWLADRGVQVELYEQKPAKYSPAHKSAGFAELICSNSLKAERPDSASGLLKIEMKMMGSHLLDAAETARVAAGGALAVDRDVFSTAVTEMVENHPNITVRREEVTALDESAPVLVASGPLTEGALAQAVAALTGDHRLSFYDAVAPIVTAESLDYDKVFAASRYGRGEADYLNCPFNKAEYEAFHAALASAERAPLHEFDAGAEQGGLCRGGGLCQRGVFRAGGSEIQRFQQILRHGAFGQNGHVRRQKIHGIGHDQPPGRHEAEIQRNGRAQNARARKAAGNGQCVGVFILYAQ